MSDMDHEVRSARMLGCEISTNPLDPLEPILKMCEYHHPDEDMSILARAYRRAVNQHSSQRRKSGEPYIIHPLAVAQILADLGMGPLVVAAGLLHDTVEDTDYTLDECRAEFGDTVTGLVDGVTKLSKMEYGDSAQAETIRKMVVAMSRDVRVLVVKLADRVHNARTWRYVKQSNAQKKARETLDVYAPLANRLGMNAIKTELEELSFKVLYPKIYNEIVVLVARRAGQRDVYLKQILAEINEDLDEQHIKAYVTGRPKDYFSIYQKMIVRGHDSGLLCGVGCRACAVEPCSRPFQRLYRHAEAQHVPEPAHHGGRSRRQAGGDSDPHVGHAPPRGIRHRCALEVQGERPSRTRVELA